MGWKGQGLLLLLIKHLYIALSSRGRHFRKQVSHVGVDLNHAELLLLHIVLNYTFIRRLLVDLPAFNHLIYRRLHSLGAKGLILVPLQVILSLWSRLLSSHLSALLMVANDDWAVVLSSQLLVDCITKLGDYVGPFLALSLGPGLLHILLLLLLRELDFEHFVIDLLILQIDNVGDLALVTLSRLTPHDLLLHVRWVLRGLLVRCRTVWSKLRVSTGMLQDLRLRCLRDLLLKAGVPRRACLSDAGVGPLIHLLEGLVMNDGTLGVHKLVHFLTTDHGVVIQWHLWVNILVVTAVLFH